MRPCTLRIAVLAVAAIGGGCQGILGIPSGGEIGCPDPCTVTVAGKAIPAESTNASPLALQNVTVRLTSVTPPQSNVTGSDGAYAFSDLSPDTSLQFDLSIPQTGPDPGGLLHTRYVAGKTAMADIASLDLPVVQYRWLAQWAWQCDPVTFPTLNDALFDPGTTEVNRYFTQRATVVGQVLKADGTPAALDRADIAVVLTGFTNFHENPGDTVNLPGTRVCFLEPDDGGVYKAVDKENSTSGRFVMFRVRNTQGGGTGTGEVRIPGYPPAALDVLSASIGFARIKLGEGEPLPDRTRTFERDVYRYFKSKRCTDCHFPPNATFPNGGVGYMTAPARPGLDGTLYRADWSGTSQQVFDNLTKPDDTGCAQGTPARVCKAMKEASLLYLKPAGLATPAHPGIVLPADDPMLAAILQWIEDGAQF